MATHDDPDLELARKITLFVAKAVEKSLEAVGPLARKIAEAQDHGSIFSVGGSLSGSRKKWLVTLAINDAAESLEALTEVELEGREKAAKAAGEFALTAKDLRAAEEEE